MNLEAILEHYDAMFGKNSLAEIEEYLVRKITEAKEMGEMGIYISLLNEIIGFCRDTTQKEKALSYCADVQNVLNALHMEGRIDYATSLLNVANAYRAFGLFEESLHLYEIVQNTYKGKVDPEDFMYASLYNNWSLLYQEMEDYVAAKGMLLKALAIADAYEDAVIPQATTKTNLAATLIQIGTEESYNEAVSYLQEALAVFEKDGGKDFHYGAALVTMGDACSYKKEFEKAAGYYEKGLEEIDKHVGRTDNYERVLEKYRHVRAQAEEECRKRAVDSRENAQGKHWISNLERCREFYEAYGKSMIHTKFPEYENRIAAGLVGEGSDCYGFDDEISTDHDYGIGFCMWLTEEDYQKIGNELQKEYLEMIKKFAKSKRNADSGFLQERRGVFSVNDFYNRILGYSYDYETWAVDQHEEAIIKLHAKESFLDYENINEYQLAAAVNGTVFTDEIGIFSAVRAKLAAYYPEKFWRKKLAQNLHDFSQYAQSNYPRMMARKDSITAQICVGKAMEAAMDLVYLLQHEYAPYYKWKKKGLEKMAIRKDIFSLGNNILSLMDRIASLPLQTEAWKDIKYSSAFVNTKDECVVTFEKMAELILEEMKGQNLVRGEDTFLEAYICQILRGKNMDVIEKIVQLEWEQFDKVQNEGGRASCQDDFTTFSIMRKSQYLTWPDELLDSFCNDLLEAQRKGWNLIMEKYARMMETTTPEKYAALEKELPVLNDERIAIQEEIIKIQVSWMEDFAKKYPKMAGNARSIRTSEDNAYNTSYETYLRGEISTYSENTFLLYGRFIAELSKAGKNLAYETMENTARLYGYESVKDAEAKM